MIEIVILTQYFTNFPSLLILKLSANYIAIFYKSYNSQNDKLIIKFNYKRGIH